MAIFRVALQKGKNFSILMLLATYRVAQASQNCLKVPVFSHERTAQNFGQLLATFLPSRLVTRGHPEQGNFLYPVDRHSSVNVVPSLVRGDLELPEASRLVCVRQRSSLLVRNL